LKKIKIIIIAALTVAVVLLATLRFGLLVRMDPVSKLTEVPTFDILEFQYSREQEIIAEYSHYSYTIADPFIIIDPYEFNPLSALILFETDRACEVEVTIKGNNDYTTFTYTQSVEPPRAEVPIIGLYAGRTNNVTLTVGGVSYDYAITTEPLPVTMQKYTLISSRPEKMADGITLFIAFFDYSNSALVDCFGQVRGFITMPGMAKRMPIILLKNGHMLAAGDEYKMTPYYMASMFEYNWLGKIFREYEIPNAIHHGVSELPNGDFLVTSNHRNMFESGTREDVAIIIDRQSGAVIREYDYREIVDETREPYHHFHPPIINAPNRDWMHMNAAIYDENDNAIIVSSPTQSMVISIDADTAEINWILGPHDGYNDKLSKYLLTPVGDGFEWQWCQHDPTILPDLDNDPDTVDILLFDNGQNKSYTEEGSVPADKNYSDTKHFRINKKSRTVELIWNYGKERGPADYSAFLGGAEYLSGNVLIAFGGQLRAGEKPVEEIISGVFGGIATRSRVVEVTRDGEVVFEVSVHEAPGSTSAETYQAKRIPLYIPESFNSKLGEVKGERLGTSYFVSQTDELSPPNLYVGSLSAEFHDIHRESDRLIVDGTLLYKGERRLIGKAYIIFRDKNNRVFVYDANSSFNGRFTASINLTELPANVYQITIAGALLEGNDVLTGRQRKGHFKTVYKITVN
jgi:arylsulfate sulfotransferase